MLFTGLRVKTSRAGLLGERHHLKTVNGVEWAGGVKLGWGKLESHPRTRCPCSDPPGKPRWRWTLLVRDLTGLGPWGTSIQASPVLVYTCCSQGQLCLHLLFY